MKVIPTAIPDVLIVEPKVFGDERGFFFESFNQRVWHEQTGLIDEFVQSNHSRSAHGVLRGLHYQIRQPQGKLVSVLEGRIFDVAVDIRPGSPQFGQWAGVELSAANHRQMYVPEGFAHGFIVLSDSALFHYHCTTEYAPEYEVSIAWNDPDIAIKWPCEPSSVSAKDAKAPLLRELPEKLLPGDGL